MNRHGNEGLRKICGCKRRQWAKCPHGWHFNFRWHGVHYRLSLDRELGKHIEGKTEADTVRDELKTAIRRGQFVRAAERQRTAPPLPPPPEVVTLRVLGETFFQRAGRATANNVACFNRLAAFVLPGPTGGCALGDKPIRAITEDDIEVFFEHLTAEGRAASTHNKYVQVTRALFRWATKKGYLDRNPIADCEDIKRKKVARRSRRLAADVIDPKTGKAVQPGEETALLAVAGPHLQRLIIAALETAIRLCELLRLEWRDIDMQRRRITVRAEVAKTDEDRILPLSDRVHGALEMAHTALLANLPQFNDERARPEHVARCFVFGDAVGRRVAVIRKAWDTAMLKAHGRQPVWCRSNTLAPESRTALRAIDLLFHDLRRGAGSRMLEEGMPVHEVQAMLGHADLSQTSTYLNATQHALQESVRKRDERTKVCKTVARNGAIELAPPCNEQTAGSSQVLIN